MKSASDDEIILMFHFFLGSAEESRGSGQDQLLRWKEKQEREAEQSQSEGEHLVDGDGPALADPVCPGESSGPVTDIGNLFALRLLKPKRAPTRTTLATSRTRRRPRCSL